MAKASIYLDKRRATRSELFPIKIRVSHKKERKYYSTGYYTDSNESLDRIFKPNVRGENRVKRDVLNEKLNKAEVVIRELHYFTFAGFENEYMHSGGKADYTNVFSSLDSYSIKLRKSDKISSSESYLHALNSFRKFQKEVNKSSSLHIADINIKWLEKYETWMTDQNKSISTVGIYLRNLRRIYNLAIEHNNIPKKWYPFGRYKYIIPLSRNKKRSLSKYEINAIYQYDCGVNKRMEYYRDLWIFSFLCQGINFKDMASLRYRDLENESFSFTRIKTSGRRTVQKKIEVYLHDISKSIINKWGKKNPDQMDFIFQINIKGHSEEKQYKHRKQEIKNLNRYLKEIAIELKLETIPTFYFARHSYATRMRDLGADIEYISQSMGHKDINTTTLYLESFTSEKSKKYVPHLMVTA